MANTVSEDRRLETHANHLDGWRGLAVTLLLVGHFYPIPGINLGTVGVNLFFALSGLLMGGLLFEKNESISRFYRRRIARIAPAHFAFMTSVGLVYHFADLPFSPLEFFSALFFFNNYVPPDAGPGTATMPLGHIWSLSVEEHSYVVLSLVAAGSRKRIFSSTLGAAALTLCCIFFIVYYQWLNPPQLAFRQWLHTEVAAYGLLASALWVSAGRPLPNNWTWPSIAPCLLAMGIVLHWWLVPLAIQKILGVGCFAAAVCIMSATRGWLAAVLSCKPLRQLGLWSYSLYLWQQPFYIWMHRDSRLSAAAALALALICGLISYYLIERPSRAYLNAHWGERKIAA